MYERLVDDVRGDVDEGVDELQHRSFAEDRQIRRPIHQLAKVTDERATLPHQGQVVGGDAGFLHRFVGRVLPQFGDARRMRRAFQPLGCRLPPRAPVVLNRIVHRAEERMDRRDEPAGEADCAAEWDRDAFDPKVWVIAHRGRLDLESWRSRIKRSAGDETVAHSLEGAERVGLRFFPSHVCICRSPRGAQVDRVRAILERCQRAPNFAREQGSAAGAESFDRRLHGARQRADMLLQPSSRLARKHALAFATSKRTQRADRCGDGRLEPHFVQQQRFVTYRVSDVRRRAGNQVVDEEFQYHLAESALLRVSKELVDLARRVEVLAQFSDLLQLEQVAAGVLLQKLVYIRRLVPPIQQRVESATGAPPLGGNAGQSRLDHVVTLDRLREIDQGLRIVAARGARHAVRNDAGAFDDEFARRENAGAEIVRAAEQAAQRLFFDLRRIEPHRVSQIHHLAFRHGAANVFEVAVTVRGSVDGFGDFLNIGQIFYTDVPGEVDEPAVDGVESFGWSPSKRVMLGSCVGFASCPS